MLIQDILDELPIASDWYKMCGDRNYRMFYHNLGYVNYYWDMII
jgi:hypothetical protein